MPTPVIYDAPRKAAADEVIRARAVLLTKKEVSALMSDPLRSFEKAHELVKTELRCWMTHEEKARVKMAQEMHLSRNESELQRDLNFVFWIESVHPKGSRNVAAVAFNGLFKNRE